MARPLETSSRDTLEPKPAARSPLKYTTFVDEPGSTHNRVVDLVPEGAHVLEFGCASGYMSQVLRERKGCTIVGIEVDERAAKLAEKHCERVIVGDAEAIDYEEALGDERYEAILFADVLEHLRDPSRVLEQVRPFLADDGVVIASIPNVAHASLRLALLAGEFRYRELGLLDDTHLRFFTGDTIEELFAESGYAIVQWIRQEAGIDETEISVPRGFASELVRKWLESDPDATTYQFIVRAVPSGAAGAAGDLRGLRSRRIEELERELRMTVENLQLVERQNQEQLQLVERQNQEQLKHALEDHRQHAQALEERIAALTSREDELHALLLDANDQLLRRSEELERLQALSGEENDRLNRESQEREELLRSLDERAREADRTLAWMQATRIWRLGQRYWETRDAVKRVFRLR